MQYAIVDIETTGGSAANSRITEIAVLVHDGTQVIERWESLVNPQRDIPMQIEALTGISNEMVRDAPVFPNIAAKVAELLTDRVFVAHNVNFDYSFVRSELEAAGYDWKARKLCTVRAARKVRPGLRSYSLGNLCQSLDIRIQNRHRAMGDAEATAILFTKLVSWDSGNEIPKMLKITSPDQRLPPNLPPKDFEQLPEKPGVYYFYNETGKVVYVGKAINLKKRVASHFSGNSVKAQRQHFLRDIHQITYEECATELMALLLECSEIQKLWPVYNTALKNFEARFGLYDYQARSGYRYLAVGKLAKNQSCRQAFHNLADAVLALRHLADEFEIDHRFCIYGKAEEGEFKPFQHTLELPDVAVHNEKVQTALDSLTTEKPSFAIVDRGRKKGEGSCIWIENGDFYGMGYFQTEDSFTSADQVRESVVRYKSNAYMKGLVLGFAEKFPGKVVQWNGQLTMARDAG